MSAITTGPGGDRVRVPPARRGAASVAVVVAVFALVGLSRWQPLLVGGPSIVVLGVVAAALSPPRRGAKRRRRPARSAYPNPSVRRWTAARESLANLPETGPDIAGRGNPAGRGDAAPTSPLPAGAARPPHPWSATGDRPLVRVLDADGEPHGDPAETMAIDMRAVLADEALIEQTMSIDIRGYLNDPGYGR
jgi:hypothetical protein